MLYRKEFSFESLDKTRIYDITPQINETIAETRTEAGLAVVRLGHTTVRVIMTELETNLVGDILATSVELIGEDPRGTWVNGQDYPGRKFPYRHYCMDNPRRRPGQIDEDYNAGRHIRAIVFGQASVTIPYIDCNLELGQFEQVGLIECDGRNGSGVNPIRERSFQVWVQPDKVFDLPSEKITFD